MATRIDRQVAKTNLAGDLPSLETYLKRRAGRRLNNVNYQALLRNNALSDVENPGIALSNVLKSLTRIGDSTEVELYGDYSVEDWSITNDFIPDGITKESLVPLKDVSVAGGELGSVTSTTPRIRLEDRINLLDSFYGRGTWPELGAGCTAFFYKVPADKNKNIGYIQFQFNPVNNVLSSVVFYQTDETTTTTVEDLCGDEDSIVVTLFSYVNPSNSETISLVGSEISLKLTKPSTVEVYNTKSGELISNVKEILGQTTFNSVKFKIVRPYSFKNLPLWYSESPNDSAYSSAESADDINPFSSFTVLDYNQGEFSPYSEKEYWFSGQSVEGRWSLVERSYLSSNPIVQDSNIRFSRPPKALRDYANNWGIRWDGYIVLDDPKDLDFLLQVETNTGLRIDIANEQSGGQPSWSKVFDSFDKEGAVFSQTDPDRYFSKASFKVNNLHPRFRYYKDDTLSSWTGYVPITIRLFYGAADKAYPEVSIPNEPNLFIKLLHSDEVDPFTLHSGEVEVDIQTSGPDKIVTPAVGESLDLLSMLQDSSTSVHYFLVKKETEIVRIVEIGKDAQGNPIFDEETVLDFSTIPGVQLDLVLDGTTIKANGYAGDVGTFKLLVRPVLPELDSTTFWKTNFISPSPNHRTYEDLIDGSFEPSIYKYPRGEKPLWWKVSDGHSYLRNVSFGETNTPLDGFVLNRFNPVLKSLATGVGLYGNGAGTYSSRPNMILGEAKYTSNDRDSQNYIGIRLVPNLLGEGGKIKFTGIPVNNSTFSDADALGVNDLGGGTNHLTAAASRIASRVVRLYYNNVVSGEKYYTVSDPALAVANDDPVALGLPAFDNEAAWAAPVTVIAVQKADNAGFTTNVQSFVSPLILNAEKVSVTNGGTTYTLVGFTTTLVSLLDGGLDKANFDTKYIKFYNEVDIAYQYSKVDTGDSVSFSDVLKFTYDGPRVTFNAATAVNYTDNTITVANHGFRLDSTTEAFYRNNGNSSIGGLTSDNRYYVYATNANTFSLVTDFDYPTNGSIVDLITGATGTHIIDSVPLVMPSEVPKPPAARVTPFGYDLPSYSTGICYPPYLIGDSLLRSIAVNDVTLLAAPTGNYDVFWGDHTLPATLGGNTLEVTERVEFSHASTESQSGIIFLSNKTINNSDYTHRMRVDFPLPSTYDEDVTEHIGNREKVKDTYYLFINARQDVTNTSSSILPGL